VLEGIPRSEDPLGDSVGARPFSSDGVVVFVVFVVEAREDLLDSVESDQGGESVDIVVGTIDIVDF